MMWGCPDRGMENGLDGSVSSTVSAVLWDIFGGHPACSYPRVAWNFKMRHDGHAQDDGG
jgi:hypothetical protein